ncbi:hydroxymethylglutaryl-CoA reductase, degradative [Lactobacillus acetotolerans]|uniref:hydroxymethylglutaryl-CoA reductase, degradative n=1 Tax=Lactobacillus acetotolerans TaxID=1600 RepID=UPI002FE34548
MKFYELTPEKRRQILKDRGIQLDKINEQTLKNLNSLSENVVGQVRLPLGLVEDLLVNRRHYQVPMAIEEPSVVAAANHGASIFAKNNGVVAHSQRNGIYGQIVLKIEKNFVLKKLLTKFPSLINLANKRFASLVRHGGGVKEIKARQSASLLYLKVLIDPAESMGANKTNSILEFLAGKLEQETGIKEKLFAILSNYPSQLTTAKVKLSFTSVGGERAAKRVALLSQIGCNDVYRGVTNNKGIMNGIDAVLVATGNDYRAVDAAAGVLANQNGKYRSLSKWQVKGGYLLGKLTLPLAIGTVGGSINARKDIKQSYRILGKNVTASDLANIIASIGLANNLAALLAISTTGIQAGHMKLQARNIVAELKATDDEKSKVLDLMIKEKIYSETYAKKLLKKIRKDK